MPLTAGDRLSTYPGGRGAVLVAALLLCGAARPADSQVVVYQGDSGPGVGTHVVLIAGDHEYRSEEILPALGRILARRFGVTCSVVFTLDDEGFIEPGSSNIVGLEALRTADLMILGLRFQDFPDVEMQHIVDYLDRAGPVVGIRTSTHAFRIADGPFAKYSWDYDGAEYLRGFGRQVLGETWVGHHGTNHEQSTRITASPGQASHPIWRGVGDVHVASGGYQAYPMPDSVILATAQPLDGMGEDARPAADKAPMPAAWIRTHAAADGTRGARLHDDARRLGGLPQRGLPSHDDQRLALGARFGGRDHGGSRRRPRRALSPGRVQFRRLPPRRASRRPRRLGHADHGSEPANAGGGAPQRGVGLGTDRPGWGIAMTITGTIGIGTSIGIGINRGTTSGGAFARRLAGPAVGLALLMAAACGPAPTVFEPGDHVVLIGNALADRMQHDGWLEAHLQAELPDHQLVIRNQGFAGDRVDRRPRVEGFPSPEDYLGLSQASLVLAMFGYNESFDGDPAGFAAALETWIAHTRAQNYSGQGAAAHRVVLAPRPPGSRRPQPPGRP